MNSPAGGRRVVVVIAVMVVLLVATIVVERLLGGAEQPAPVSAASPVPSSVVDHAQRTVLIQALDSSGLAIGDVLLGSPGESTPAAMLTLQHDLLVPVPELVPLSMTPTMPDTLAARRGVESLLGVRVDASLSLGRLALAALVDSIGGLPVYLDRPLEVVGDRGEVERLLPSGSQRLDGVAAAAYALTLRAGEADSDRSARFTRVMRRVLAGLPSDREGIAQVVLSLGSLAKSTATNEELVSALLALRGGVASMQVQQLPTVQVRAHQASVLARPAGPALVVRLLPEAVIDPAMLAEPVVGVWAAGASAAQVAWALGRLGEAGFTPIARGQAVARDSVVLVSGAASVVDEGRRAAAVLDLPVTGVEVESGQGGGAAIDVLVGEDLPVL